MALPSPPFCDPQGGIRFRKRILPYLRFNLRDRGWPSFFSPFPTSPKVRRTCHSLLFPFSPSFLSARRLREADIMRLRPLSWRKIGQQLFSSPCPCPRERGEKRPFSLSCLSHTDDDDPFFSVNLLAFVEWRASAPRPLSSAPSSKDPLFLSDAYSGWFSPSPVPPPAAGATTSFP